MPFAKPTGYNLGKSGWVTLTFGPDDVQGARDAFDIVYSMTDCERRRYRSMGIESPRVRWCPPQELSRMSRPTRKDGEVRLLFAEPGDWTEDSLPIMAMRIEDVALATKAVWPNFYDSIGGIEKLNAVLAEIGRDPVSE